MKSTTLTLLEPFVEFTLAEIETGDPIATDEGETLAFADEN
jgi:hypothetical protein